MEKPSKLFLTANESPRYVCGCHRNVHATHITKRSLGGFPTNSCNSNAEPVVLAQLSVLS